MKGVSVVAMFCEDIRDELRGTHSLIGILPDNMEIPAIPGILGRLSLYARIQIEESVLVKSLRLSMQVPGQDVILGNDLDAAAIRELRKGTIGPFSTILTRIVVAPLPINVSGRIKAILTVDGEDEIVGYLNINASDN